MNKDKETWAVQFDTDKFCDDCHRAMWIAEDTTKDEITENSHDLGKLYLRRLMTWLHKEFVSGRHQGKRLLDLCSGPNIHSVISASRCFDEIILCDIGEANVRAVRKWIRRDETAYDWTEFCQFVAELEDVGTTASDVEQRTRDAVRAAYQCDLRKDLPFGDAQSEIVPVDCITAMLAIQASSSSLEEHRAVFKRITGFLKPGGSLVTAVVVNSVGGYKLGDELYHALTIDQDEVIDVMTGLGYVDINCAYYPAPPTPHNKPGRAYLFISAHL